MRPVPIMLVSDDPSTVTGLGRITRDLAHLLSASPRWRVATLGLGGTGSRHFPWTAYHMHKYPHGAYEYGELSLCQCWDDFTLGTEGHGVVMTIFDVTRMLWLARPEHLNDPELMADVKRLRSRVKLWGYFMQDHEGPQGVLTRLSREVLLGYDRILMTSPFGVDVVKATIGTEEADKRGLDWMPHGIWMDTFTQDHTRQVDSGVLEGSMGDSPSRQVQTEGTNQPSVPVPLDPLEVAVGGMDHSQATQDAVADVERLQKEGKL